MRNAIKLAAGGRGDIIYTNIFKYTMVYSIGNAGAPDMPLKQQ